MKNKFIHYNIIYNNCIIGTVKTLNGNYDDFHNKDWPFDRETLNELRSIPRLKMISI